MYHEEKVISGVLWHRSNPSGDFMRYTLEELTQKYEELKAELLKTQLDKQ
jgi:hypothetical protein